MHSIIWSSEVSSQLFSILRLEESKGGRERNGITKDAALIGRTKRSIQAAARCRPVRLKCWPPRFHPKAACPHSRLQHRRGRSFPSRPCPQPSVLPILLMRELTRRSQAVCPRSQSHWVASRIPTSSFWALRLLANVLCLIKPEPVTKVTRQEPSWLRWEMACRSCMSDPNQTKDAGAQARARTMTHCLPWGRW